MSDTPIWNQGGHHQQPRRPDTPTTDMEAHKHALTTTPSSSAPQFTSSFSSFGLRQPNARGLNSSTPQGGGFLSFGNSFGSSGNTLESYSPFNSSSSTSTSTSTANRRPSLASNSTSPGAIPTGTLAIPLMNGNYRKNSILGLCEPISAQGPTSSSHHPDDPTLNGSALELDEDDEEEMMMTAPPSRHDSSSTTSMKEALMMNEEDSPMMIGSPSINTKSSNSRNTTPPPSFNSSNRHVPPSPAAIAKALQAEQKTPPPFLQRRLFHGGLADDLSATADLSMNTSTRASSISDIGEPVASTSSNMIMGGNELGLIRETRSASGSGGEEFGGNGSSGGSGRSGIVRRAVSRKPNLLPKSKSHLRVLSDLRSESGPADLAEVLSEAALHRLSRSGASPISAHRSSSISSLNATTFPLPGTGNDSHSGLANRFPEQIDEETLDQHPSPPSSDGDDLLLDEVGSDWGGTMSLGGYDTENEEEQRNRAASNNLWTGFRNHGSSIPSTMMSKSPNHGHHSSSSTSSDKRGGMEIETIAVNSTSRDSPQTPSWQSSARPGKRKLNDDRFEPYASAFKRRAVSPAALSPAMASPLFPTTSNSAATTSPAALLSSSTFPTGSLPISIPSPTLSASTHIPSYFNPRSRATSPVPSSLSSSAGRPTTSNGAGAFLSFVGRLEREEKNGGEKMGDEIGKMSLG